jgi:hypothetical protein
MKCPVLAIQIGLLAWAHAPALSAAPNIPASVEKSTNEGSDFKGERVVLTHSIVIDSTPEKVFPLLCPVREGEWAEHWVGKPIYSISGVSEENAVFATKHPNEEDTIWFVINYDKNKYINEMLYYMPKGQLVRLYMRVFALEKNKSRIEVQYVRTGLNDRGNQSIITSKSNFIPMMKEWERSLNHYLTTGKMLRSSH